MNPGILGYPQNTPALSTAWANINGSGRAVLRAGLNIASVVYNGAGDYTVKFVMPYPSANIVPVVTSDVMLTKIQTVAADSIRINTFSDVSTPADASVLTLAVFGNQ